MGLSIGFITILLVGFFIIRGYNAKGVLFVAVWITVNRGRTRQGDWR